MGLNGILSSARDAISVNTTALNTVADNISNVDTDGYVKRTTNFGTTATGGVEVTDISRTVSQYINQEALTAYGTSSQYDTEDTYYDQINAMLGEVGDGTSLASEISDITDALATASQASSEASTKASVVSALETLATRISGLYTSLSKMRNAVDDQISTEVDNVNSLIEQIADLNNQIRAQDALGDEDSGLQDQRDAAIQDLAQLIDIQTSTQSDGSIKITTDDGTLLVGSTYAQLSYALGDTETGFGNISLSYVNPNTGKSTNASEALDSHISSGTLRGLLDMRDTTIGEFQTELGTLAQSVANAYNDVSNDYSAYPPAQTLTGRQTGLSSDESLNIDGTTTIAVVSDDGEQQTSYSFDFSGMSIDDIISEINSNVSGVTASYDEGKLVITADDSDNGIVVDDSANTGSTDFSAFFGLNDLFETSIPSYSTTGLSGTSSCNLTADGTISLQLKDADGKIVESCSVSVTSGESIDDLFTDLSDGLDNAVTFTLESDGSVTITMASGYSDCTLTTTGDDTERSGSGVSMTEMLGIGDNVVASYAAQFSIADGLDSSTLPLATITLGSDGDTVLQDGDSAAAIALQDVETNSISIAKSGNLAARTSSIGDYANAFYQDVSTRSSAASDNYDAQSDRLTEAQNLQSSDAGVNLDEELANMVVYQQAYSASARLLTMYTDIFDTLIQIGQ